MLSSPLILKLHKFVQVCQITGKKGGEVGNFTRTHMKYCIEKYVTLSCFLIEATEI